MKNPTIYSKPDTGSEGFISEKAIKGQGMTHSCRYVEKIHIRKGALTLYPPAWTKKLTNWINLLSGLQCLSQELKIQWQYSCFTTDQRVRRENL